MNWMEHEIMKVPIMNPWEKPNKNRICKNCGNCGPTYKGGYCRQKDKKVKMSGTCEEWRAKK